MLDALAKQTLLVELFKKLLRTLWIEHFISVGTGALLYVRREALRPRRVVAPPPLEGRLVDRAGEGKVLVGRG